MPKRSDIYVGNHQLHLSGKRVKGELVDFEGEIYYKIDNYDQMRPFFMSLTSDSDVWIFISSNGGLTAGRKNADHAIFPYYTDDKLADLSKDTGSKSLLFVEVDGKWKLWSPFSETYDGIYRTERNLYKNTLGNKLIFEELNRDLGLLFRVTWQNSQRFGLVKKSELVNLDSRSKEISLLDGVENIMPPGVSVTTQQTKSNLANAYKKCELRADTGIGIFSLSSNIIDRPEPSEALLATTVGIAGLKGAKHLLCSRQVKHFSSGEEIKEELNVRAEPGAYFISKKIGLKAKASKNWYFMIDTDQSAVDIDRLENLMITAGDLTVEIQKDIQKSTNKLKQIVSQADGIQLSQDKIGNMRHVSNTLFNVMRGGIFANGYLIEKDDFLQYIKSRNKKVFNHHIDLLENLPGNIRVKDLKAEMKSSGDDDLLRYSFEYLPITFSRRHGDPSRPWNKFNIDVLKEDGSWNKSYEGNWRDIFQNWEALSYSYPEFIENIITLFLNASTRDGYNPYRITNRGIEWEVTDPDDPWSFIGYWGDHQIIYLLKLLEISKRFYPGELENFVDTPFFTFANVPYRIKDYADIVKNPYSTILYDETLAQEIEELVEVTGVDGKLIRDRNGSIAKATLTEKLLIPLLTKLSNFVPEGGIWMNTQRPEWNDANNALVGHGLSMVTVCYMYRYLKFLGKFYRRIEMDVFHVNEDLEVFFAIIKKIFQDNVLLLAKRISDTGRKQLTESLGFAGQHYRHQVYKGYSGKQSEIKKSDILHFIDLSQQFLKHTIKSNRQANHLYHAYNLLELNDTGFGIKHLYTMLEGQVAALSSGFVSPEEALLMLTSLRQSELYRKDQNSYILYPDRSLSKFMSKAVLDKDFVSQSVLLKTLLSKNDNSIIEIDNSGNYHFNPALSNANELKSIMDQLIEKGYREIIDKERDQILNAYETVFNHHAFTGRSGSFFGYEGLGSIYWHMNSKLLLAVQEIYYNAEASKADPNILADLGTFYYEIKEGLGAHKSPDVYGAFPTDPYSHTPAGKGAQQPGMTGQVKEDIMSRLGELGISVKDSCLQFSGSLLGKNEFLKDPDTFEYFDLSSQPQKITLEVGSLAFTFCQIPIIYNYAEKASILVHFYDGKTYQTGENKLPAEIIGKILSRTGEIARIEVNISN